MERFIISWMLTKTRLDKTTKEWNQYCLERVDNIKMRNTFRKSFRSLSLATFRNSARPSS